MSKLGVLLKEEREKKGLAIHEVGLTLKINPKILRAIEEGDEKDLPAKTFIRGFVKSYANYLKLDQKTVLDLFTEEYGGAKEKQGTAPGNSAAVENEKADAVSSSKTTQPIAIERSPKKSRDELSAANQNTNKNFTFIAAGILLVAIAFVAKIMDKYKKESNVSSQAELIESISVTTTIPSTDIADTAGGISSEDIDPGVATNISASNSEISNQNAGLVSGAVTSTTLKPSLVAGVSTTTTSTTSTTKMPTTTTPSITTTTLKPSIVSTTTTTTNSTSTTTTTTSSTTTTTAVKTVLTEVIVEALNQVKIRFSLNDGQKWETIDLTADKVHTFRSKSNIQLEVSDGGAINIIINGRDRGVPGTIGKPIKLTYPK